MSYDLYPKKFYANDSCLSTLVIDSALGINLYQLTTKFEQKAENAIETLSEMFFELSKRSNDKMGPLTTAVLSDFHLSTKGFKARSYDDLRQQSQDLGKDLAAYKNISKSKQTDLINLCCELHRNLLSIRDSRRRYIVA